MNSDYRRGVDDGIEACQQYLHLQELKARQCMKLCELMNLMGEWKNQLTYCENIKIAQSHLHEVRINFLMNNADYSLFIK